jgi:uncharacterized caspase-like protein
MFTAAVVALGGAEVRMPAVPRGGSLGSEAIAQDRPARYALVLGSGRTEHEIGVSLPFLRYVEKDVRALQSRLQSTGYEVTAAINPRRERVLEELQQLRRRARPTDTVLIFWAGLAVRGEGPAAATYWLTRDTELVRLESTAIRISQFSELVRDIAGRKVLLMDVFYAGNVVTATPELLRGPPTRLERLPFGEDRILVRDVAPNVASEIAVGDGTLVVLASARHDPGEIEYVAHGAFAFAVLEALNGAADADRNQQLTAGELVRFLEDKLPELAARSGFSPPQVSRASHGTPDVVVADTPAPASTTFLPQSRKLLGRWYGEGLISASTLIRAQEALDRLAKGTQDQMPDDLEIVSLLRPHIDSYDDATAAAAAASLEALVASNAAPPSPPRNVTVTIPPPRGAETVGSPREPLRLEYEGSYALLIGVGQYRRGWPRLPGVPKDLVAVRDALQRHHLFEVETLEDPDRATLEAKLRAFIASHALKLQNRIVIYFAGHGYTRQTRYGEEMGYILPADTPLPQDEDGFFDAAIDMRTIEAFATRAQSRHVLFVFDSCFAGSIFSLYRSLPENISYKTGQPVRQFITSGSANETVPDRSFFREQFVRALEGDADVSGDGYLTGTELGEYLQERVTNYSKGTQHPQHGKLRHPALDRGDFVFVVPPRTKAGRE